MKILVVDDEPMIIDMVAKILSDAQHEILSAGSTEQAMEKLSAEEFDLVITDVVMPPGEDGTKLASFVKKNHPRVPVIAMTAGMENATEDYVNYADMFTDHALAKPFKPSELLEAIEKVTVNTA